MICCIIQARTGSARLPKKVIQKIDNDLTTKKVGPIKVVDFEKNKLVEKKRRKIMEKKGLKNMKVHFFN